jgi:hypothetical protein
MPRPAAPVIIDPQSYIKIVGSTFVKKEHVPVLQIGSMTWDRWQLGKLGIPHPAAAAKLNRVIQELRIRSLDALAKEAQTIGNYKGLGVTCYYTILAILEQAGYDPEKVHGESTTYLSVKSRALKNARANRKRKPRRAGPPSEAAEGASA